MVVSNVVFSFGTYTDGILPFSWFRFGIWPHYNTLDVLRMVHTAILVIFFSFF